MTSSIKDLLELKVRRQLKENIEIMKQIIEDSVDIIQRDFVFHGPNDISGVIFYADGLTNAQVVETEILRPLMIYSSQLKQEEDDVLNHRLAKNIKNHLILNTSIKLVDKFETILDSVLSGDAVLFLNHTDEAFISATKGWDARSVEEPQTEAVVRGPRDGFTENIRTNTALLRRRVRDPLLRVEGMKVGDKSKTDINIAYVKGTVKEGLVEEVKNRLQKIKIDLILESGYIEEFIEDAPLSPFSTVQSTERPDKVAASIYEGRVAIFVDNTPFVLIVPSYFWQYIQASDDYYSRYWVGSFFRIIRYIAFILSLTLPSLYVLLASFHTEMIPTPLALTIASGREANPFPVLLEALIMEISFELMREAGLRLPRPVGTTVSIIGSLVVGQAAVQAGIVSPFMLIVVAVTGVSSFAIPNYATAFSLRLVRFPLLIASGTLGLLGFSSVLTLVMLHTLSLRSFGEPYLSPASPFKPTDQKDFVLRFPWWKMNQRPEMAKGEQQRMENDQMPLPPNKKDNNSSIRQKKQKQERDWRKK